MITEKAPQDILAQFEDEKWQEKKEAYAKFATWLLEQEYSGELFEASFWFIKIKLKDFKESNVNIVKSALQCVYDVVKGSSSIPKKAAVITIPFLSENIGNPKYKDLWKECLLSLAELVSPGFVIKYMVKNTSSATNPNVMIENNVWIGLMIEEFGPEGLPVQEVISLAVSWWDNKNAKVRTETINMLWIVYKHLGESIRTFLKDIKDSTLSLIDSKFSQITPLPKGQFQSKREIRNEEVKQEVEETAGDDPMDSIPRADVSKELGNQKLIALINDDNWKHRKEAVDKMNDVLKKSNMRILPNGLGELVGLLKVKMADSNKSVSKGFLEFVGDFAIALGGAAKNYAPMLLKPMLRWLSEKNTLVRQVNIEAVNKWASAIGPENIVSSIGAVIEKENPEIRVVLLDWMLKNKDSISKSNLEDFPKSLVSCIQDKIPAIRSLAEEVMIEVIPFVGPAVFRKIVSDLKPAIQNTVKPQIEKWLSKSNVPEQDGAGLLPPPTKQEPIGADKAKAAKQNEASLKNKRPNTAAPMSAK